MGLPNKKASTTETQSKRPQHTAHMRAYQLSRANESTRKFVKKLHHLLHPNKTGDVVQDSYEQLDQQLATASIFVPAAIHTLYTAGTLASVAFNGIVQKKGEGADDDFGEKLFGVVLGIAVIVAPELACVAAAAKMAKATEEAKEAVGATIETTKTAGEVFFNVKKLVKESIEENPYLAESYRLGAVDTFLDMLDNALQIAIDKIAAARILLGNIRTKKSSDVGGDARKAQSILDSFSLPEEVQYDEAKGMKGFHTALYEDILLYDLLKEYTRRYVVCTVGPGEITFSRGIDDPKFWDKDDKEEYQRAKERRGGMPPASPVTVKGMDGRKTAFERVGWTSPFLAQLLRSGRRPVNSWRDLVNVWGARFETED